ncbi:MAG: D-alanyl-D-alanine carboxypeptidase [Candidatus Levybacteria bacterium]|nr:D-alanyl-D-alanine carboxypeptidase [Candidatus Levybacteria bacterium]
MKDSQSKKKKTSKKSSLSLQNILLFLLPLILLSVLAFFYQMDTSVKKELSETSLPSDVTDYTIAAYPLFKQSITPFISAQSALVMEDASKVVIFSKNPGLRFSTASTAKVMTALVGIEFFAPDDVLTFSREKVEGTVVGFKKGESMRFSDLLYALLLPSGNDAAYAIADNYPGGTSAFVEKMNEKARSLYLLNTNYVDPAGLDDEGNYTTAYDLANLSSRAIKNPILTNIFATKRKVIANASGTGTYELESLNKLLGINGVTGIKTGFTQGAGGVLATSKIDNGHVFIIVVMKSQDRFFDTQTLLSLVSNNITYFQPVFQLN